MILAYRYIDTKFPINDSPTIKQLRMVKCAVLCPTKISRFLAYQTGLSAVFTNARKFHLKPGGRKMSLVL